MKKSFIGFLCLLATATSISSQEDDGAQIDDLQAEYKQFGVEIAESAKNIVAADGDLTYRLPNNTRPIRYDLWILTDVEKENFNFSGRVKITIRAIEMTDFVTLQYRETIIDSVTLVEGESRTQLNATKEEPLEYEFLRIDLPRSMAINEIFDIEIIYHGELHWAYQNGFYKANYTDTESGNLVWYATTKFEPHHARHLFPCYDEPQIRAPIILSVQHDKNYTTYANMPLESLTQVPATDYVISRFQESPPMQTYLLAFLTSKFEYVSNNASDVEQRIFAKPQSIIDGEADYAAEISDALLKKLEELLNVHYPLPKLDHAAITQFPSGAVIFS
jgi:aminopeptidase N